MKLNNRVDNILYMLPMYRIIIMCIMSHNSIMERCAPGDCKLDPVFTGKNY